jgi:hypothetical protein
MSFDLKILYLQQIAGSESIAEPIHRSSLQVS